MLSEVDVFVSNYTLVDPEVYQLWVDGQSCKIFNLLSIKILLSSFILHERLIIYFLYLYF